MPGLSNITRKFKKLEISIPYPVFKKFPLPSKTFVNAGYTDLAGEGFPKKVSEAFQKAADELNCVIWSRVPGKVCTTLIDEGYNLKPFYVHGKSCNWGPMAGFVCQLPALNKAGASKMIYNLNEHVNSLKWLSEKQVESIRRWEKENKGKLGITNEAKYREMGVAKSLFLPLSISDKWKKELTNSEDSLGKEGVDYHKINNDLVVGLAQDKNKTVAVEYVMKKRSGNSNLWDIYHRNIYINDGDKYVYYLQKQTDNKFAIVQNHHNVIQYNDKIQDSIKPETIPDQEQINLELTKLLRQIEISSEGRSLDQFYAVNGIQSPYLAYTKEDDLYKNAVSGDYDLFAVWPFTPNASFEMTTRISERASKPSESDKIQRLFIPVEAKENAIEITKSRNVFIEFIGTYKELDGKEDRELGNINDLVSLAAQTLNSLIRAQYLGKNAKDKGQFPNRAFHSDEGGRPGVDEIEYPIACFMPKSKSLWNDLKQEESRLIKDGLIKEEGILKNTAFVVNSHVDFLSLILLLRRRFYIFLHDGWFMHFMCLAADNERFAEILDENEYLQARGNERVALAGSLEKIRPLLKELLTPLPPNTQDRDTLSEPFNTAFNQVINTFIQLASQGGNPPISERRPKVLEARIEIPSSSQ